MKCEARMTYWIYMKINFEMDFDLEIDFEIRKI